MQIQPIGDINTGNKNKRHVDTMLYALPVIACAREAILNKGRLAQKAVATTRTAGSWGAALLLLGVLNIAQSAIISKSKKIQKFTAEHPLASMLTDIAVFMAALTLGGKGAKAVMAKVFSKNPDKTLSLFNKLQNTKRAINNTALNKTVLKGITKGVENLKAKAPWIVNTGRSIVRNSVILVFLASIIHDGNKARQNYI